MRVVLRRDTPSLCITLQKKQLEACVCRLETLQESSSTGRLERDQLNGVSSTSPFSSMVPELLSQLLLQSLALSSNLSSRSGPSNHQSSQSHTDKNPHPQWLSIKWFLLSTESATEGLHLFAASANISN